jgi:hypothetical protein
MASDPRHVALVEQARQNVKKKYKGKRINSEEREIAIATEVEQLDKVSTTTEPEADYWDMFARSLDAYNQYEQFQPADALGMYVVEGRGHCLFLAMSMALFGTITFSRLLRVIAGGYLLHDYRLRLALAQSMMIHVSQLTHEYAEQWKSDFMEESKKYGQVHANDTWATYLRRFQHSPSMSAN